MARIEPVFGSTASEIENPYRISAAELIEEDVAAFSTPKIFDFSGRISLSRYWLIQVPFVLVIPTVLLAFFIVGLQAQPMVLLIVAATVLIPSGLLSTSLLMRRARDLSWSPAWGIISMLVPGIGFIVMLLLVMLPGRRTPNKYGLPNPSLSAPVKILTGLLVVFAFASAGVLVTYFPDLSSPGLIDRLAHSFSGTQG